MRSSSPSKFNQTYHVLLCVILYCMGREIYVCTVYISKQTCMSMFGAMRERVWVCVWFCIDRPLCVPRMNVYFVMSMQVACIFVRWRDVCVWVFGGNMFACLRSSVFNREVYRCTIMTLCHAYEMAFFFFSIFCIWQNTTMRWRDDS